MAQGDHTYWHKGNKKGFNVPIPILTSIGWGDGSTGTPRSKMWTAAVHEEKAGPEGGLIKICLICPYVIYILT